VRVAIRSQHRTRQFGRGRRAVVAASGFLLVTAGFALHAQVGGAIPTTGITYYVNSAGDLGATDCNVPNNTDCGIDDAIRAFNGDTTTNDADTIVFNSDVPTFYVTVSTAISNTTSGVTLAINGNGVGNTAVSGGGVIGVFDIDAGVTVTISDLTIEDGYTDGDGGAISNSGTLTVTNDDFSDNMAAYGDGGAIEGGSSLTVANSTFYDNGSPGNGGAIESVGTGSVNLTITGSTFYENGTGEGDGGAISYGSGVGGNLKITNSTFYDNFGLVGGGAVESGGFDTDGNVTVTDSTFSANNGGTGSGGAINIDTGSATISNTILSSNNANFNSTDNCGGTITNGGDNISYPPSDISCPATFGSGNPNLGPLRDNGGPTQTMAIGPGSSAYELVPAASCTVDIDQRGDMRPGVPGANCDAGAYEYQAPSITSTPEPGSEVLGGAALQDSATLGNISNLSGTGAITFNLYGSGDSSCTTSLYTTTVSSITSGGTYNSTSGNNTAGYEAEVPGTYNWTVSYGGDANNASVSSACGSEPVTVSPVSPTGFTTAVTAPASTAVGNAWNDAATVTGNTTDGAPTGSVAFTLCSVMSPATTCTGGSAVGTVSTWTTNGDASTFTLPAGDAQSPGSPGTYCYNASYSPAAGSDYSSESAQSDTECFTVTPGTETATITAVDGLDTKAGTNTLPSTSATS
jgi:hypothetical protein